jgi:hypothetical protein
MQTCEVIGWLVDTDRDQVLIREQSGQVLRRTVDGESMQTGTFRRNAIVDAATREIVGYDMERISSPL